MTKKVKKEIQVLLLENLPKLGHQDSIIKVKPGFVRNYLLPMKIAKLATPKLIKQTNLKENEKKRKNEQYRDQCILNKKKLESLDILKLTKKVGQNDKIFGKVTLKETLDLIINNVQNLDFVIEKTQLKIPEIKQLGVYVIEIFLYSDIKAQLKLEILPE